MVLAYECQFDVSDAVFGQLKSHASVNAYAGGGGTQ